MARGGYRREGPRISEIVRPDLRRRAHYAVDRATAFGKALTRQKIRGAGLGRLANAVDATSSLKRGKDMTDNAWGAIYARGKTEGRGNQALLAYSEGATIVPTPGKKWLAFATDKIPKRAGRFRMTPARYKAMGLEQTIGKLRFVLGKNGKVAYLVATDVTVSRRTGRARGYAGRTPRGADRRKTIVAFVLIRFTRRAQAFNQDTIMRESLAQVPRFAAGYQSARASS